MRPTTAQSESLWNLFGQTYEFHVACTCVDDPAFGLFDERKKRESHVYEPEEIDTEYSVVISESHPVGHATSPHNPCVVDHTPQTCKLKPKSVRRCETDPCACCSGREAIFDP